MRAFQPRTVSAEPTARVECINFQITINTYQLYNTMSESTRA